MVEESWVLVFLDVGMYLDGSAAPVLPCIEDVGGGEGSDCFDDVGELRFGGIRPPWAGACVGSGVVGKGCDEVSRLGSCPELFPLGMVKEVMLECSA